MGHAGNIIKEKNFLRNLHPDCRSSDALDMREEHRKTVIEEKGKMIIECIIKRPWMPLPYHSPSDSAIKSSSPPSILGVPQDKISLLTNRQKSA